MTSRPEDGPALDVGTSSGHNAVWHGYSPYNPRMVEKYLTIFRTANNWTFVGNDGKTPAMRLGFARQPLDFGLERQQAEPVTQSSLDAALAQLETKLTWRLIYVADAVVAAIKLIPGLY